MQEILLLVLLIAVLGGTMLALLNFPRRCKKQPKTAVNLFISLTKLKMTQLFLPSATATLSGVDANGLATTIFPGDVVWSVSDPSLFSLTPGSDANSVVVTPLGVTEIGRAHV